VSFRKASGMNACVLALMFVVAFPVFGQQTTGIIQDKSCPKGVGSDVMEVAR
jgi:hypothetical protein